METVNFGLILLTRKNETITLPMPTYCPDSSEILPKFYLVKKSASEIRVMVDTPWKNKSYIISIHKQEEVAREALIELLREYATVCKLALIIHPEEKNE